MDVGMLSLFEQQLHIHVVAEISASAPLPSCRLEGR